MFALLAIIGAAIFFGITSSDIAEPEVSLDDLREQEVIFLEDKAVFLVYNEGDPLALSADAQHLGDQVEYCSSSEMFESPAHGEKFDRRGYYYGGPAQRGLERFPVRIQDDGVYIDLEQPIQGPARGEGPVQEPAGALCVPG